MAYIPGYQWDVFVSYARFDDSPMIEGERGWVSTFVNALKVAVGNYLGVEIRLFFDLAEAQPGRNNVDDLKRAAAASATMVAVASPSYCVREWTRVELETFSRACPDPHRLLVIERLPLGGDDCWPDLLDQKIRLQFWEELPYGGAKAPIAPPNAAYFQRLMDFANRLQVQLRAVRDGPPPGAPSPAAPARPADAPSNAEAAQLLEPAPAHRVVLLAQGTDDVLDEVESVHRSLTQYSDELTVLPDQSWPQGGEAFRDAFEKDLAAADIFVQLLGSRAGRSPPDLPEGYTRFQLARARAAGKTILQWRHADLDVKSIADKSYKELVGDPAVIPSGLEEFKRLIREHVGAPPPAPVACDRHSVFISADKANLVTAQAIAEQFIARKFEVALPMFDGTARENRAHLYRMMTECGILLVINGARPPDWFDTQKRLFEVIRPERACEPIALAVCSVPPADPLEPEALGSEFFHIDCSDGYEPADVRRYIESLERGSAGEAKQELSGSPSPRSAAQPQQPVA